MQDSEIVNILHVAGTTHITLDLIIFLTRPSGTDQRIYIGLCLCSAVICFHNFVIFISTVTILALAYSTIKTSAGPGAVVKMLPMTKIHTSIICQLLIYKPLHHQKLESLD